MKVRGYESITFEDNTVHVDTFVLSYFRTKVRKYRKYFLVRKYFRTSRSTVQFHYTYVYCTTTDKVAFGDT